MSISELYLGFSPDLLLGHTINDKYELVSKLGSGGFGAVYKAIEKLPLSNKREIAIKVIHVTSDDLLEKIKTEIAVMAKCIHKNIVPLLASEEFNFDGNRFIALAMELADGSLGDLLSLGPIEASSVNSIALDICEGLDYLHNLQRHCHRDLKPYNILRFGSIWRIADFGLTRAFASDPTPDSSLFVGTMYFMPPEAARGEYGPRGDCWSFAVTLHICLTGKYPYINGRVAVESQITQPYHSIIASCLTDDYLARPDAKDLLAALRGGQMQKSLPLAENEIQVDQARTVLVGKGDQADYTEIADAIAQEAPGSVILVDKGSYYSPVRVKKPLTIDLAPGVKHGEVNLMVSGSALVIESDNVKIKGLHVTVLAGKESAAEYGVLCMGDRVSIEECTVIATRGCGIHVEGQGTVYIGSCTVHGSEVGIDLAGGVIEIDSVVIKDCMTGIKLDQTKVRIINVAVSSCDYGVKMHSGSARVHGTRVIYSGVGMVLHQCDDTLVDHCYFEKNQTRALECNTGSSATFEECSFSESTQGEGILLASGSQCNFIHCRVNANVRFAFVIREGAGGNVIHCEYLNNSKGIIQGANYDTRFID